MKTKNQILKEKALKALHELFSDTSVDVGTAMSNIHDIKDEIYVMLDALESQQWNNPLDEEEE